MSFFDIFKKKVVVSDPSQIKINLSENGITINGASVSIPSHIDKLTKLLGKPRRVVCPKGDDGVQRINYAWDELGLYCYTEGGLSVHCIGIHMNKGDFSTDFFPTQFFKGTVTINGAHWFNAMSKAVNLEVFKKLTLGKYSAVSEFVDFEADDATRTEKDYTGIEIQLENR